MLLLVLIQQLPQPLGQLWRKSFVKPLHQAVARYGIRFAIDNQNASPIGAGCVPAIHLRNLTCFDRPINSQKIKLSMEAE
jgi:hypothetical protein